MKKRTRKFITLLLLMLIGVGMGIGSSTVAEAAPVKFWTWRCSHGEVGRKTHNIKANAEKEARAHQNATGHSTWLVEWI